jgi:hypothetical protein
MKRILSVAAGVVMFAVGVWLCLVGSATPRPAGEQTDSPEESVVASNVDWMTVTERYRARVDRVNVVFEQVDYTRFRLQTNGLVRTGELNTERGFKDDAVATVYVLNWQKPEGERMYYVRLTTDPTHLFVLDSERKIIQGSALTLQ